MMLFDVDSLHSLQMICSMAKKNKLAKTPSEIRVLHRIMQRVRDAKAAKSKAAARGTNKSRAK